MGTTRSGDVRQVCLGTSAVDEQLIKDALRSARGDKIVVSILSAHHGVEEGNRQERRMAARQMRRRR